MSKLQHILFGILFILSFGTWGQSVRAYPMEEKSLLWKIEGDQVKGDVYLFGTMHLIEKEYFYYPKKLQKIAKSADVIVMEIPGLPDPASAMQYVLLKEGTFFDYFNAAQTDTIVQWAKEKLGYDENQFRMMFKKMKPFAIVQLAVQQEFAGKTESYEMTFDQMAKDNKINMEGFETLEEQMAIFDSMDSTQITEMVMESIRNGDQSIETMKQMMVKYNEQDIDALYAFIKEEGGTVSEMEDDLLVKRNHNWIEQLPRYFDGRDVFIAVGAGHLGGPEGLIRLMEKEGLTVTPVKL